MNTDIRTGVCNQVDLNYDWFTREIDWGIDLDLLKYKRKNHRTPPDTWESNGPILLGDWKQVRDYTDPSRKRWKMVFDPDKEEGGSGFAAIFNMDVYTIQVVWSIWIQQGRPASPCYPNQNTLLEKDGYMPTYSLPPEAFFHETLDKWGGDIEKIKESDTPK